MPRRGWADGFDSRQFHNVVPGQGSVLLQELARAPGDAWLAGAGTP